MKEEGINIMGIQETRYRGILELKIEEYTMIGTAGQEGTYGVAQTMGQHNYHIKPRAHTYSNSTCTTYGK
eukprot:5924366-Prorocentrum_lima.AAC.1